MRCERVLFFFKVALVLVIVISCRKPLSTAVQEDLGKGNGTDVITIGDSWMSYDNNTGIQDSLRRLSGQPYRQYGAGGTQLLDGEIPGQYARAKQENANIKTVIMTGGGNDLLRSNARADLATAGPFARMRIDQIANRLVALWTEMSKDGVRDIIYVFYSRGGGIAASVDYGTKKNPAAVRGTETGPLSLDRFRYEPAHGSARLYSPYGRGLQCACKADLRLDGKGRHAALSVVS